MNDKLAIPAKRHTGRLVLHWLLALMVIGGGTALAFWFINTAPRPRPRPPEPGRTFVETVTASFSKQPVVLDGYGTVTPARMVIIQPRVSGEVIEISPNLVPGGLLKEGDLMLRVDPADYELAVPAAQRALAEAESALRTEEGNQAIAKKDFELLGQKISEEDRDLVLRLPQLAAARAAVAAAKAALSKAQLDLDRTTISAPFNAIVEKRGVERGAQLTLQTQIATLIGTDAFWVEVAVPAAQLRWLEIPATGQATGSKVRIFDDTAWGTGAHREGRIIRKLAGVEEQGRLARLLVEVEDPLALKPENAGKPAMLTGAYIRAEIEGRELASACAVHRDLVHDGDRLWIFANDETLDIRKVNIAFRGHDTLLVTGGIAEGERIVKTQIPAPVQGMALRTKSSPKPPRPGTP